MGNKPAEVFTVGLKAIWRKSSPIYIYIYTEKKISVCREGLFPVCEYNPVTCNVKSGTETTAEPLPAHLGVLSKETGL